MAAWRVGVLFDQVLPEHELNTLVRYMPIWAVSTPSHRSWAEGLRHAAGQMWFPDPAFTVFNAAKEQDGIAGDLALLDMVELHHPGLASLILIGIDSSYALTAGMRERKFVPANNPYWPGIVFRKPLDRIDGVAQFVLDASKWQTSDDVYDSFFSAVGASSWHGRNFDALDDSIETGSINQQEIPYWLIVKSYAEIGEGAREMAGKFIAFISELEARGIAVAIRVEQ
jgi:hypothetical protein